VGQLVLRHLLLLPSCVLGVLVDLGSSEVVRRGVRIVRHFRLSPFPFGFGLKMTFFASLSASSGVRSFGDSSLSGLPLPDSPDPLFLLIGSTSPRALRPGVT